MEHSFDDRVASGAGIVWKVRCDRGPCGRDEDPGYVIGGCGADFGHERGRGSSLICGWGDPYLKGNPYHTTFRGKGGFDGVCVPTDRARGGIIDNSLILRNRLTPGKPYIGSKRSFNMDRFQSIRGASDNTKNPILGFFSHEGRKGAATDLVAAWGGV